MKKERDPKSGGLKNVVGRLWYRFGRALCRIFCLLFFKLRVYGREHVPDKGPVIIVSNHQSYMDPVFCGVGVKRHLCYMARDTLFKSKILGWMIASVNAIPVKRGSADIRAMRAVMDRLNSGKGVCLFPEATRTSDGRIASFKGGFSLLCRRTDAAIVPVVIDGAYECWPRHKKLWTRGLIVVRYGKIITAEEAREMDDRELAQMLTDRVRQMQGQIRKQLGRAPYTY